MFPERPRPLRVYFKFSINRIMKKLSIIITILISFLFGVFFSLYFLKWGWRTSEDFNKGNNCVNMFVKRVSPNTLSYKKIFCIKAPIWVN